MLRFLSKSAGFTLVELTTVVAITGILAAVAVPNYLKYVARSRQGEAKILLSQIYTAEKALSIEHGSFTECIRNIGVTSSDPKRYYAVGFNSDTNPSTCGSGSQSCMYYTFGTPPDSCVATDTGFPASVKNYGGIAVAAVSNLGTVSTDISRTMFRARAVGNIYGISAFDRWSIDETKALLNYQVGM